VLPQALPEALTDFLQFFDEPPRAPLQSHPGRRVALGPLPEARAHLSWQLQQEQALERPVLRGVQPQELARVQGRQPASV